MAKAIKYFFLGIGLMMWFLISFALCFTGIGFVLMIHDDSHWFEIAIDIVSELRK